MPQQRLNSDRGPKQSHGQMFICAALVLLAMGCSTGSEHEFRVETSSMAPHLRGVRYVASCNHCASESEIAAESLQEGWPVRCLRCGGDCKLNDVPTQGDSIKIVRTTESPKRFDVVAIERSGQPALVKRVWGLPGEQLTIQRGELWLDGRMLQKSLHELRCVAVPLRVKWRTVKRGTVDLGETLSADRKRTESFVWHCKLPAPVHPSEVTPAEWLENSSLSDATPIPPPAGVAPLPSGDVYLKIHLQSAASDLIVAHTYFGQRYRVVINATNSESGPDTDTIAREFLARRIVELAFCDQRVLLSGDDQPLAPIPIGETAQSSHVLTTPSSIEITCPSGTIESIELSRDIILRSTQRDPGERQDFARLGSTEYFVLGDNQAYSDDSRGPLGFIKRHQITGHAHKSEN